MPKHNQKIINALKKCGIKKNDVLLLHSDISKLGRNEGTLKYQLENFLYSIKTLVGKNGTIVVPAFYFEYSRHSKAFKVPESPVSKELGLFPSFFCKQKNVLRSLNPLTSVAALGKKAKYICQNNEVSAYGVDSPFDKLTKLKAKMAFIGVDCRAMNYLHYVEYMVGVPHVYNKLFSTDIYFHNKKVNLPVCNQVRYLDFNVNYDRNGNTKKFEKAGLIKKVKFEKDYIRVTSVEKIFNFVKKKLKKNFYYLLKHEPKFKKKNIPLI
jgi:aminoglycoside 3-N-acetyltransferase